MHLWVTPQPIQQNGRENHAAETNVDFFNTFWQILSQNFYMEHDLLM